MQQEDSPDRHRLRPEAEEREEAQGDLTPEQGAHEPDPASAHRMGRRTVEERPPQERLQHPGQADQGEERADRARIVPGRGEVVGEREGREARDQSLIEIEPREQPDAPAPGQQAGRARLRARRIVGRFTGRHPVPPPDQGGARPNGPQWGRFAQDEAKEDRRRFQIPDELPSSRITSALFESR